MRAVQSQSHTQATSERHDGGQALFQSVHHCGDAPSGVSNTGSLPAGFLATNSFFTSSTPTVNVGRACEDAARGNVRMRVKHLDCSLHTIKWSQQATCECKTYNSHAVVLCGDLRLERAEISGGGVESLHRRDEGRYIGKSWHRFQGSRWRQQANHPSLGGAATTHESHGVDLASSGGVEVGSLSYKGVANTRVQNSARENFFRGQIYSTLGVYRSQFCSSSYLLYGHR